MARSPKIWKSLTLSLVCLLLFRSANMVSAGINTWTSIGPAGIHVTAVAIDSSHPNTIYAGTLAGGIYKTTNGGNLWGAVNSGLGDYWHTDGLAVDPGTPTILYAAMRSETDFLDTLFKTVDGGENWFPANSGIPGSTALRCVVMDPGSPGSIYVGALSGIYISADGGANWSAINNGLPATPNITTIAINPDSWDTLYAGSDPYGVYKSTDNGANWTQMNNGLTNTKIMSLAINPNNTTTVFAGTYGGGVFKSTDGGANWVNVNSGLPDMQISSLAIDPLTPAEMFASTGGGLYKSTNHGNTWSEFSDGLPGSPVDTLTFDPVASHKLYAGTVGEGIYAIHEVPNPGAFGKSSPGNGSFVASLSPTLFWGVSDDAADYRYCIDTVDNGSCDTSWTSLGGVVFSVDLSGLSNNTTYYWQVRASNAAGTETADGGTWWSFTARNQTFADVPVDHPFWDYIEAFFNSGITTGCGTSPLIFCPENTVTRASMAVFLLRAKHGSAYSPPASAHIFADLPVAGKEWQEAWVNQFYSEGITTGCGTGPLIYCPENPVTRAAMAVFILRNKYGASYTPPAASHFFSDMPVVGKEWMEPWVDELYREGITTGCGTGPLLYCPENPVKRKAMAAFIVRAFNLPLP